ncbi:hypothetical protein GUJ93_ZPchr0006g42020 [Zizania palustris]|uniref:Uncharacterized protein n=1 Tax=Zizania palustris TaxID=103762 RepID=A0A8J5SKK7_ZIZPA|nr:hypothetical protein GUJ93_ZPchr0006g42020 [Zizania palustris]
MVAEAKEEACTYMVVSWPPPWVPVLTKKPGGLADEALVAAEWLGGVEEGLHLRRILAGKTKRKPSASGSPSRSTTGCPRRP